MILLIEKMDIQKCDCEGSLGVLNFNNYLILLLQQANDLNEIYYNEDAQVTQIHDKWQRKFQQARNGLNRADVISERAVAEQFTSIHHRKNREPRLVVSLSELKEVVEMAHIN